MNNETLEQEAPVKETRTPKQPKPLKPADLPEPSQNQSESQIENEINIENFVDEIQWIDGTVNKRTVEEPLQLMVYYKVDAKNKTQGKITFSYFLSEKFGKDKKFKFGALKGKIIFQVTDQEGLNSLMTSNKYSKLYISNKVISETIFEKYGVEKGNNSTYFKLKDLGNDFYLIDEIIK